VADVCQVYFSAGLALVEEMEDPVMKQGLRLRSNLRCSAGECSGFRVCLHVAYAGENMVVLLHSH